MHLQTITLSPSEWSFPSQRRILLVDDEPAILMPTSRYFRRLAFQVDSAASPAAAFDLMSHCQYDAAILDLRFASEGPEGSISILKKLRVGNPEVRVIVFSGFISGETEAELRRHNVDAILQKPQPLAELAKTVLQLMGMA